MLLFTLLLVAGLKVQPHIFTGPGVPPGSESEGLEPGTTYYVQVSSQNAAGTVSAPPVPFIRSGKRRK